MAAPNDTSSYRLALRTRFALMFLKTLKTMNNHSSRHRLIKLAAYSSMARTVGSTRLWSRAFLIKHRRLATTSRRIRRRRLIPCNSSRIFMKKNYKTANTKKMSCRHLSSKSDELRHLVPGGKVMDDCTLIEEAAHYIHCLATQVKVMQTIVDHYISS